jgi:hypothetical protein
MCEQKFRDKDKGLYELPHCMVHDIIFNFHKYFFLLVPVTYQPAGLESMHNNSLAAEQNIPKSFGKEYTYIIAI